MKIFSREAASDLINDLVGNSGSVVIDCEVCGRTHYDRSGDHMDDGELARLEEKAGQEPDRFIGHDGSVYWGTISDKNVVIDCPCNLIQWFEQMLWSNRHMISDYLIKRSKTVLTEAEQMANKAAESSVVNQT